MDQAGGWVRLAAIACFLAYFGASIAHTIDDSESPGTECGPRSLYTLLRLNGFTVSYEQICQNLPASSVAGHSLKELRDAARVLGFGLSGIRLPSTGTVSATPAILFLDRDPHGHFLVVRSVGHTGKLVQVFDGFADPFVMDAAELRQSPAWTGLALVPSQGVEGFLWGLIGIALAGVLYLGIRSSTSGRRRSLRLTP